MIEDQEEFKKLSKDIKHRNTQSVVQEIMKKKTYYYKKL